MVDDGIEWHPHIIYRSVQTQMFFKFFLSESGHLKKKFFLTQSTEKRFRFQFIQCGNKGISLFAIVSAWTSVARCFNCSTEMGYANFLVS